MQYHIAVDVCFEFVRTLETKRDGHRVGTRGYHKVVFQLPLVAVVDQVNARIELFVSHLGISVDICDPLLWIVADEVVVIAGEFIDPRHRGRGVGANELHA